MDKQKGLEEKRPASLSIPDLVEDLLRSYEEHGMANLEQNLPSRQEVSEFWTISWEYSSLDTSA